MNRYRLANRFLALSLALGSVGAALAAESPDVEKPDFQSPDFQRHVLPLLYHRCFSCHSQKQESPKGGLRLDSAAAIRDAGVVVPGKPDASELLRRVSLPHADQEMMPPLKGGGVPLTDAQRTLLRRWIADGAPFGAWTQFQHRDPPLETVVAPLARGDVARLAQQLDRRVERHHAARGTRRNDPIDDSTFLRRVYLDVAGRIPSLDESRRFLDDPAPNKRAALVDSLLDGEAYVSHTFNWKADQLRILTRSIAGQPGWLYDEWVKDSIRSGMTYDQYVRQLVTARGYLWENGAVGFYLRDLGMPLDHMSNLARVFLGTRIECAQCHDHPLEPVTQKDFYQLAAYTFGNSNLYSSAGYSNDNVRQWPEIKARLDEQNADEGFRQGVSRTISYLKRLTKDTDHQITFPKEYLYDEAARGRPVSARTPFGDEAPASLGERRPAFADWLVSPRNPRFARNIANRLWKRAIGAGLVEPVDSLSAIVQPEHAELLDFLTRTMIGLGFDERAFLAVVLNSRLYQSQSVREAPEPGAALELRGPLLRRLSAEQIWDSLLVLLVEDVDVRKNPVRHDRSELSPERLRQLTRMTADEILERAKVEFDYRIRQREHVQRLAAQRDELAEAKARGDAAAPQRLKSEHAEENARFEAMRNAIQMGGAYTLEETDPRWRNAPRHHVRASETPMPIPLGHFLRQFGQSDRREIDAFNRAPNATHSLALMNGELTRLVVADDSLLRTRLRSATDLPQRLRAIYQAILGRSPDADELKIIGEPAVAGASFEPDLIWALINSPEFLFIQ